MIYYNKNEIKKIYYKIFSAKNKKQFLEKKKIFDDNCLFSNIVSSAILNIIYQSKLSNTNKVTEKYSIKNFIIKIYIFIKNFFQLLQNEIFYSNIFFEKYIYYFSNKLIDQYNIKPIWNSKKNNKSLFIINNITKDAEKLKITNSDKKLNIHINLRLRDYLIGYFDLYNNHKKINLFINLMNFNKKEKSMCLKFYLEFFIYKSFFSRNYDVKNIKCIFSNFFISPDICALIYVNENKAKKVSYQFHGLGYESVCILHNNTDVLLYKDKIDTKILYDLKKNNFYSFKFPKKFTCVGSGRYFYLHKKFNTTKKKEKSILNVLYIKSNSIYLNNMDNNCLNYFIKTIKKFSNFDFKIKDRPKNISDITLNLIQTNNITKNNISYNELIEKDLLWADICVGTFSSALLRQALEYKKIIIQLNKKNNSINRYNNYLNADNFYSLEKLLKNFKNKKYLNKMNIKFNKLNKKNIYKFDLKKILKEIYV